VTLLIPPRPIAHKSSVNHIEEGAVTRLTARLHRFTDSPSLATLGRAFCLNPYFAYYT